MSPSATLWTIGISLFGIIINMVFYAFVVGRKVEKIEKNTSDIGILQGESKDYEGRISFLEGEYDGRRA